MSKRAFMLWAEQKWTSLLSAYEQITTTTKLTYFMLHSLISHPPISLTCDGVSPPLLLSFIRPCEYKTLIFHYISSMCLCMDIIHGTQQKARFFSQIYGVRTNSPQLFSPLTQRFVSMTVKLFFGTKKVTI